MSLKTWKQQFMPEPANEYRYLDGRLENKIAATKHSLRKWVGARPRWQKEHDVHFRQASIVDAQNDVFLAFDGASCALCQHTSLVCDKCPLSTKTNNCVNSRSYPYGEAFFNSNPEPMIKALKTTLRRLIKQQHNSKQHD